MQKHEHRFILNSNKSTIEVIICGAIIQKKHNSDSRIGTMTVEYKDIINHERRVRNFSFFTGTHIDLLPIDGVFNFLAFKSTHKLSGLRKYSKSQNLWYIIPLDFPFEIADSNFVIKKISSYINPATIYEEKRVASGGCNPVGNYFLRENSFELFVFEDPIKNSDEIRYIHPTFMIRELDKYNAEVFDITVEFNSKQLRRANYLVESFYNRSDQHLSCQFGVPKKCSRTSGGHYKAEDFLIVSKS